MIIGDSKAPVLDAGSSRTAAFHEGEVALQLEAGVAERLARVGAQVIRGYLPEQHREFYPLLPFVVVGAPDAGGQPHAALLAGPPGFVSAPDATHLRIDALPRPADPLFVALETGAALGVLGIQLQTRRRNRVNGHVVSRDARGLLLKVEQSFGNCPRYIHPREARYLGPAVLGGAQSAEVLGPRERSLIAAADTFFIASSHPLAAAPGTTAHGADVSHRGGPPGFVQLTGNTSFCIPDYPGNNFHNTLGNLRLNPAAGLLFIDFRSGDALAIEAIAELRPIPESRRAPDGPFRELHFECRNARWSAPAARLSWD